MNLHKNKAVIGLFICILLGILIFMLGLFHSEVNPPLKDVENLIDFNEEWTASLKNNTYDIKTLPIIVKEVEFGETIILNRLLPSKIDNDTYLFFRASHQKVKVYIDNKEVYSFGWNEEYLFGKSPACAWILAPVLKEQAGKDLQIELTGAYPQYAGRINGFYMGTKSSVLTSIIADRLGSIIISIVLVILGFSMIFVAFVLRKGKATKSLLRLGILSVLVGIWSACTVNILQVFTGDVFTLLNIEFFTFLMLLPISLWFLDSFDYYKERKVLHILFWCSLIITVGIHLLQLFNVADYMETISIEHLFMFIAIIYLLIDGMKALLRKKEFVEVRILIISVISIIIFAGLDLLKFYFYQSNDDGFFTRTGMLIFIIIWALEIVNNMSQMIVRITQTQMLEILAYQDQMTGIKNRSAFEEKLEEYRQNKYDAYIITFDMNDLKMINDSRGHAKGDEIIKGIADILKTEFKDYDTVYRIGGDEFCVIISKDEINNEEYIKSKITCIKEAVLILGKEQSLNLSLASGYSNTTVQEHFDIDSAYRQADKRMYIDKNQSKNNT